MQGAVGGLLVGGGMILGGPAHTLGANPDPDGSGDNGDDDDDEQVNSVCVGDLTLKMFQM